jgi:hypothetical protein
MVMHRRLGRLLAGAGVALTLGIAGIGPAAADTHIGGSGQVGVHVLADSAEYPGATCRYDPGLVFSGVRVRPPFVYARDRSGDRDRQRVAWRVVLQRLQDESLVWQRVASSPWQEAPAWDDTTAAFSSIRLDHAGEAVSAYRVVVRMRWSMPGDPSRIQGTASHRVDHHRSPVAPDRDSCSGAIL